MRPLVEQIRAAADSLTRPDCYLQPVHALLRELRDDLLPHERAEEAELVPILAKTLGGADPAGAISRTHAEIEHYIDRLDRTLHDTCDADSIADLQRLLYGLYAILRLHNVQEEKQHSASYPNLPSGPPTSAFIDSNIVDPNGWAWF